MLIEPEITLVLSPITNTTRLDERGSHFIGTYLSLKSIGMIPHILLTATVPTVGDALQALEFISEDISTTLRQISDLGAELANKDHIVIENIKEILRNVHVTLLQELDIEQKRSLICQEIERVRQVAKATAKILFGMFHDFVAVATD